MITAAPNTGVIKANILKQKSIDIVIKGNSILLCLIPGIHKVLRVIKRLVKEIVELIPAKKTDIKSKS
jgi:hypothetical protein